MSKDVKWFEGTIAQNCDVKVSFDSEVRFQVGPRREDGGHFRMQPLELETLQKVEIALEYALRKTRLWIEIKQKEAEKKEDAQNAASEVTA